MARSVTEVTVGPGTLYVATQGTAYPADPSVTPAGAWADIGYSDDGWSFNVSQDIGAVEVAEETDPVALLVNSREIHVVGAAAQPSVESIQLALGGGTITTAVGPPATKTYVPPTGDTLTEKSLLLRVKAPGTAKTRDIQLPRVVPVAAVELAYRKGADNKTLVAQDWRAMKPSAGDTFKIVDLT